MGIKRLLSIIMAASTIVGFSSVAQAIEYKFSGTLNIASEYQKNPLFQKGDGVSFVIRARPAIDFIVNENLSAGMQFQFGTSQFGSSAAGVGSTSNTDIKLRRLFVTARIPGSENVAMTFGIQNMHTPSSAFGSFVLDDNVAGVSVSYDINKTVGLNLAWNRPYVVVGGKNNVATSAIDYFEIDIPLHFSGVDFTPWASFATITKKSGQGLATYGSKTYNVGFPSSSGMGKAQRGLLNAGIDPTTGSKNYVSPTGDGFAWWAGASLQLNLVQNLEIGFDGVYGGTKFGSNKVASREGFIIGLNINYKLPMFTPTLKYWYASGNGRNSGYTKAGGLMPSISASYTPLYFAFADSSVVIGDDGLIGGYSTSSTQGIVFELADITFIDNLSHFIQLGYMMGTTNKDWVIAPGSGAKQAFDPTYLTTKDSIFALNFVSSYKIYENFSTMFGVGYMHMLTTNANWYAKPPRDILSLGLGFQYNF